MAARGHCGADYLIYVDQKAVGVIEASPVGTTLSGLEWQSSMYAEGLPAEVRLKAVTADGRLPFVFETSGSETHFTSGYDPSPRGNGRSSRPSVHRDAVCKDKTCTFPGCGRPPNWCDAHHITHWINGGETSLTNMALLCAHHHTYIHRRDLTATVTAHDVTWHT